MMLTECHFSPENTVSGKGGYREIKQKTASLDFQFSLQRRANYPGPTKNKPDVVNGHFYFYCILVDSQVNKVKNIFYEKRKSSEM